MLNVSLEDVMCEHPIKVKESIPVGAVSHLLLRYRINGILVVADDNDDIIVGIFTTTDVLRLIDEALSSHTTHKIEELERVSEIPVGEVASKDVVSLQKDTKVIKAVAIMHKRNVHTLPVYEGDKLVGVVGRHDVINLALN